MDERQADTMRALPLTNGTALTASATLGIFSLAVACLGQGTMTFTFEVQPRGTVLQIGGYTQSGMHFAPAPFGSLLLNGGGMPGYPGNGTGYLELPDNGTPNNRLTIGPTAAFPTSAPFNLISFDAARYADLAPPTLTVVGYSVMASPVTNYFTVASGGSDFQTFHPDASFVNLFEVEVYGDSWGRFSLDNLVISGVPEPSADALVGLGTLSALSWEWVKRRRPSQSRCSPQGTRWLLWRLPDV
jgi:hypothetical protein